jgi:AraC-like DNA-binding protein
MQLPTISFEEFCHYTTHSGTDNEYLTVQREHPDFGSWYEQSIVLDHIKVYQHRANLKQQVGVMFKDSDVENQVHHCISLGGAMDANFINAGISANLSPKNFHQVFVPENEYLLGMGCSFINVHIEVDKNYYVNLLSEDESWSAQVRETILNNQLYYPGQFALSMPMMQTIHDIFNSPLSGSLKKLLIEAKVHELIALQLNSSLTHQPVKKTKNRDLFFNIQSYLDQNYLKDHSLKSITKQFGINEFTLKKGFKDNFNTTVFDYILVKRLENARELLLYTDKTIQQIASITGYKYPNHFCTAFKKRFGVTPATVRN